MHHGTPVPVAPTETLVVAGVYRFVRHPMYLAVLIIILAQALLFGSWPLALYAVIVLIAVVAFVKGYEEPTLASTYGEQYLKYRGRHRRAAMPEATAGGRFPNRGTGGTQPG